MTCLTLIFKLLCLLIGNKYNSSLLISILRYCTPTFSKQMRTQHIKHARPTCSRTNKSFSTAASTIFRTMPTQFRTNLKHTVVNQRRRCRGICVFIKQEIWENIDQSSSQFPTNNLWLSGNICLRVRSLTNKYGPQLAEMPLISRN